MAGKPKYTRVCTAHKTNGEPCKAAAMKGQKICRTHGGTAPQNLAAARQRILEASDPAAAELVRLSLEAEKEGDRLKAIGQVLDRSGVKPDIEVESDDVDAEVVIRWRG